MIGDATEPRSMLWSVIVEYDSLDKWIATVSCWPSKWWKELVCGWKNVSGGSHSRDLVQDRMGVSFVPSRLSLCHFSGSPEIDAKSRGRRRD